MGNFTINSEAFQADPKTGITGRIFGDNDSDGLYTNEDTLLEGVQVELYDDSDTLIDSVTSNVNGIYSFGSRPAGTYYVIVSSIFPDGYNGFTSKDVGSNDSIDSDVNQDGRSDNFTLNGSNQVNIDAGLLPG